jgi:hypothetical protein
MLLKDILIGYLTDEHQSKLRIHLISRHISLHQTETKNK